ncbi:hypothetical protein ACJIZ3_013222 [Penstemon smallii]|uniref:Uncharacterized protein n=1 Tax=Penstemon smallii TaxID=265156 RepID=A0ABD3UQI8_9LAMI
MMLSPGLSPNVASNNSRRSTQAKMLEEEMVVASFRGLCRCRRVQELRRRHREPQLLFRQPPFRRITCGGACSTREAILLLRLSGPITLISQSLTPLLSMTGCTVGILGANIAENNLGCGQSEFDVRVTDGCM